VTRATARRRLSPLASHLSSLISISLLCPLSPFTLTHLSSLISFFSSLDLPLASCPLALLRSCPLTRRPFTSYLLPHVFHLQPLTSLLSPLIVCGLCYANSDVERTIYLTTESHKGAVTRATARRRFSPLAFHLSHLISILSFLFSVSHPTPRPPPPLVTPCLPSHGPPLSQPSAFRSPTSSLRPFATFRPFTAPRPLIARRPFTALRPLLCSALSPFSAVLTSTYYWESRGLVYLGS
jgi:hypothetical protein